MDGSPGQVRLYWFRLAWAACGDVGGPFCAPRAAARSSQAGGRGTASAAGRPVDPGPLYSGPLHPFHPPALNSKVRSVRRWNRTHAFVEVIVVVLRAAQFLDGRTLHAAVAL